jgi:hypothetical protein
VRHCQLAGAAIRVNNERLEIEWISARDSMNAHLEEEASCEHGTRWARLGTRFGVAKRKNIENLSLCKAV